MACQAMARWVRAARFAGWVNLVATFADVAFACVHDEGEIEHTVQVPYEVTLAGQVSIGEPILAEVATSGVPDEGTLLVVLKERQPPSSTSVGPGPGNEGGPGAVRGDGQGPQAGARVAAGGVPTGWDRSRGPARGGPAVQQQGGRATGRADRPPGLDRAVRAAEQMQALIPEMLAETAEGHRRSTAAAGGGAVALWRRRCCGRGCADCPKDIILIAHLTPTTSPPQPSQAFRQHPNRRF